MKLILNKPDIYGAIASSLCMLHCFTTPLLFIAHASSGNHAEQTLNWWKSLDYLFLMVSFFAVYRSTKITSSRLIKRALWCGWGILFLVIINEKLEVIHLAETFTYVVAATLILLHLYSLNYCQCKNDKCCAKNG